MTDPDAQLPTLIECTQSFIARLPSQRIIDLLSRMEPDMNFSQIMEAQPPRMIAFRALLRDYPDRDPTSLWMHAYDCEIGIVEVDPTNGKSPTLLPPSAPSTA